MSGISSSGNRKIQNMPYSAGCHPAAYGMTWIVTAGVSAASIRRATCPRMTARLPMGRRSTVSSITTQYSGGAGRRRTSWRASPTATLRSPSSLAALHPADGVPGGVDGLGGLLVAQAGLLAQRLELAAQDHPQDGRPAPGPVFGHASPASRCFPGQKGAMTATVLQWTVLSVVHK